MPTYEVTGAGGTRTVVAKDEAEAKNLAMIERWGDVSDNIVPRQRLKDGTLEPYTNFGCYGLSVKKIKD